MSSAPDTQGREWPERVLIADIAHPSREEAELELLPSGEGDFEDLVFIAYVREGSTTEETYAERKD